jgi:para-aminobenzoate synthetase/4-amino-4-deoxychorismate lyase
VVSVRFDDLRPYRRRSFEMVDLLDVIEAHRLDQIKETLARAEAAVAAGKWVAGFLTYEAAPAFDPALTVIDPAESRFEELPLAWFSIWERRGPSKPLPTAGFELQDWLPRLDRAEYESGVGSIKRHIRSGDTYQVNYTFRLEAGFTGNPRGLYQDLINSQSCGYGALVDTGRWVVVSASPELFFEWRHGGLVSKPMKGTRRRGLMAADDEAQRLRLQASEKDRAENLMIVDMVRNDLGRVARVGTVQVPSLFTTEKYDTVWQLTSTVKAEPRAQCAIGDVFGALFPSASITGAPKVATMQIIAALEADPRGVYCGAVGFGGPDAGDDVQWAFNVAIRTVLIDRSRSRAHYGTGGGITYDSTPAGEYEEARLKTAVLARQSSSFHLLETIRWTPEEGFWLHDRHLTRLVDSAGYFDVPLDPAEVRAALNASVSGATLPQRLRLLVDRSGRITVDIGDLPSSGSITAAVDWQPVERDDPFLYHKTTNRRMFDEARARNPDADDVILINREGSVTETTLANLVVELEGVWVTPPVSDGLLPGTYRAELLARGRLTERSVTIGELKEATRVARINSLRGWEPAEIRW